MASRVFGSNSHNYGHVTSTQGMNSYAPIPMQGGYPQHSPYGGQQNGYNNLYQPNLAYGGQQNGYNNLYQPQPGYGVPQYGCQPSSASLISYGYNNPMCSFNNGYVTNQYSPGNTYLPMGYSEVPLPPQTKMEYIPYESYYIDYVQQQYCQSVMVPCQKRGTDYYAVEHVTDYVPREYEETLVQMIPHEKITQKLTYVPVQTHIVHYPDESKPLYSPQGHHNQGHHNHGHSTQGILHRDGANLGARSHSPNNSHQQLPVTHQGTRNSSIPQNFSPNKLTSNSQNNQINTNQSSNLPPNYPPNFPSNLPPNYPTNQTNNFSPNIPRNPPQTSSQNNPGMLPSNFNPNTNVGDHKIVQGQQLSKINSKYPPPHAQSQDALAGGQVKSHHRVVTSKPLNEPTSAKLISDSKTLERKTSETANLMNLANQSVKRQTDNSQQDRSSGNYGQQRGTLMDSGKQNNQPPSSFLPQLKRQQTSEISRDSQGNGFPNLVNQQSYTSNQSFNKAGANSASFRNSKHSPSLEA